ncbi:MAG: RsmE family RNA methyltransferase [Bacillota bacterium]
MKKDQGHTPPLHFVEPSMVLGNQIILTREAYRHALAQRLSPGEAFRAVLGETEYSAVVEAVLPGKLLASITGRMRVTPPAVRIHLYSALLKHQSLDLVVEKATELGVAAFTPIVTNRTIPRLSEEKALARKDRWARVAKAAAQQSGRGWLPEINRVSTLEEVLDRGVPGVPLLAHEHEGFTVHIGSATKGHAEVSIIVGPEGGLDASEVERLLAKGFIPVSLGPYILKAETAGIAAVAVLMSFMSGCSREP